MKEELEEVIVARSCEPEDSHSKYLGVEVSIGTLEGSAFAEDLKRIALNEDNLWQKEKTGFIELLSDGSEGEGEEMYVSRFLDDLFNYNDIYHNNGLVFFEEILTDEIEININSSVDREKRSTENFIFSTDINTGFGEGENYLGSYEGGQLLFDNKRIKDNNIKEYYDYDKVFNNVKIPEKGNYILNIKFQDCYFTASGLVEKSKKGFNFCEEDAIFNNSICESTKNYEENKFLITPEIDKFSYFHIKNLDNVLCEFSILHGVNVEGKELKRNLNQEQNLEYYSVHLIIKDNVLIGGLTNKNNSFTPCSYCFPLNTVEWDSQSRKNKYLDISSSIGWVAPWEEKSKNSATIKDLLNLLRHY